MQNNQNSKQLLFKDFSTKDFFEDCALQITELRKAKENSLMRASDLSRFQMRSNKEESVLLDVEHFANKNSYKKYLEIIYGCIDGAIAEFDTSHGKTTIQKSNIKQLKYARSLAKAKLNKSDFSEDVAFTESDASNEVIESDTSNEVIESDAPNENIVLQLVNQQHVQSLPRFMEVMEVFGNNVGDANLNVSIIEESEPKLCFDFTQYKTQADKFCGNKNRNDKGQGSGRGGAGGMAM